MVHGNLCQVNLTSRLAPGREYWSVIHSLFMKNMAIDGKPWNHTRWTWTKGLSAAGGF